MTTCFLEASMQPRIRLLLWIAGMTMLIALMDAIAGRLLQAHLDFSWLFALYAGYLAGQALRIPTPPTTRSWLVYAVGVGVGALYFGAYRVATMLLVGWNRSPVWTPAAGTLRTLVLLGIGGALLGAWAFARPASASAPAQLAPPA